MSRGAIANLLDLYAIKLFKTPLDPGRKKRSAKAAFAKLLANAIPEPNSGCLLYMGSITPGGYGHVSLNGRSASTHRIAWEAVHGPIPKGLMICHKCDVPACMEIRHLFLGTAYDNVQDSIAKGRRKMAQPRIPKPRPYRLRKRSRPLSDTEELRRRMTPYAAPYLKYLKDMETK